MITRRSLLIIGLAAPAIVRAATLDYLPPPTVKPRLPWPWMDNVIDPNWAAMPAGRWVQWNEPTKSWREPIWGHGRVFLKPIQSSDITRLKSPAMYEVAFG